MSPESTALAAAIDCYAGLWAGPVAGPKRSVPAEIGGHTVSRFGSAGVGTQPVGSLAVAQFRHHLALNLAYALPGQPEELADLI